MQGTLLRNDSNKSAVSNPKETCNPPESLLYIFHINQGTRIDKLACVELAVQSLKSSYKQKFPPRTREKIYHVLINVKEWHCLIFPAQNKQYPL